MSKITKEVDDRVVCHYEASDTLGVVLGNVLSAEILFPLVLRTT